MRRPQTLLTSALTVFAACTPAVARTPPTARAGVLDLSGSSMEKAPFPLAGEWHFYWGALLGPEELGSPEPGPLLTLPTSWNAAGLGGEGFSTQSLLIRLPPGRHDVALQFGEIMSASRMWVNGSLVLQRGTLGRTRQQEVPDTRPGFVRLPGAFGTLHVVLQISNHFHFEGGPVHPLRLGKLSTVEEAVSRAGRLDYLMIGATGMVFIFFAFLFAARPREPAHLLFALVALVLLLRVGATNWHVLSVFPGMGTVGQIRLDYFTLYTVLVLYWTLMATLFPGEFPSAFGVAFAAFAAIGLLSLVLPPRLFTLLREPTKIAALAVVVTVLVCVLRAVARGREGAWFVAGGAAAANLATLWDVVERPRFVAGSRDAIPMTLVVLVAAHAAMLGRRLSRSLNTTERLAGELSDLNQALEARVAERTVELERLATTDPLTGLNNRRNLLRLAEQERARAAREGHEVAVLLIDADDFKQVNDAHGHLTGDEVLRALARALLGSLREQDVVGRYGGEEFVVVLQVAGAGGAHEAAERLRTALGAARAELAGGQTAGVTVTVGYTLALREELLDHVLERADRALYAAKAAGRDRVAFEPAGMA
jgi:diguanylate cyclase (GGDEF)-like protein